MGGWRGEECVVYIFVLPGANVVFKIIVAIGDACTTSWDWWFWLYKKRRKEKEKRKTYVNIFKKWLVKIVCLFIYGSVSVSSCLTESFGYFKQWCCCHHHHRQNQSGWKHGFFHLLKKKEKVKCNNKKKKEEKKKDKEEEEEELVFYSFWDLLENFKI